MVEKFYTVDEANELLPYLAPTLVELREKFEEAGKIQNVIARAAVSNGGSPDRDRWTTAIARVGELLQRLDEWSIELRDVDTGLVDFPSVIDGDNAWLCWRLGETEVEYWHRPDEGFASRRPL